MRTLVDIPDKQIADLARICEAQNLSRAEVIRQAIVSYISANKQDVHGAFGIWGANQIDGLIYQEKVRSEW